MEKKKILIVFLTLQVSNSQANVLKLKKDTEKQGNFLVKPQIIEKRIHIQKCIH